MNCEETRKVLIRHVEFLVTQESGQESGDEQRPNRETVHAALAHIKNCVEPKCQAAHSALGLCLASLRYIEIMDSREDEEGLTPQGWNGDY